MYNNDALIRFISNNHTPPRAKLVLDAIETILAYNILDIVPHLEGIVLNDDNDTMGRIEAVKACLIDINKTICRSMNIIPYQEISDFPKLSKVITALDVSQTDYYADYILENTLLEADDESALGKLYSLVYLITGMSELDFYDVIHSVDDKLIDELLITFRNKVVPDIECDDPVIVTRYREFIRGRGMGVVHTYISAGGQIGISDSDGYLGMFSEAIAKEPVTERPFDIISAVLISDTPEEELTETIAQWADYFSDSDSEKSFIEREIALLLE